MKKTVYGVYGFIMAAALALAAGCEGITDIVDPAASLTYKAETGTTPNGTITVTPENAEAGANVNIIVEPDQGFRLKAGSLKVNSGAVALSGSGKQWTFVMPASNVTVTAEFEAVPDGEYPVSIGDFANGTVTGDKESAEEGDTVTLTVTPDAGHKLKADSLKANDGAVDVSGSGNTWTFTMPASEVTVTAAFEPLSENEHSVTIDSSLAGGGIGTDKASAEAGDTVTLTVTPAAGYGYTADSLTVTQTGGGTVPVTASGNTWTFTMPAGDVTVTAAFTATSYTISITPPSHGAVTASVSGTPATAAAMGTSVTLTASAADGYQLQSITVTDKDGKAVPASGTGITRTFTMPASGVTVQAVFVDQSAPVYTVSIPASFEHGKVNAGSASATAGTPITLTAAPESGYQLASITVTKAGGGSVEASGTGNTRTFTMPAADVTVAATFTPRTYTITTSGIANGTVTANPASAATGTEVTLTVSAADGYQYTAGSLKVNGSAAGISGSGSGPFTFTMPASTVTVTAVFGALPSGQYNITVPAGITANKQNAAANETVTLTVAPVAGYQYTAGSLSVNNGAVTLSGSGPYTFNMPDAAVTVTATFTAVSYTITTSGIANGTVTATVNGATVTTATVGAAVTLTASAAGGYKYTENSLAVTQTGGGTVALGGSGTVRTFTMPAGSVTVAAAFEALPPDQHNITVPAGITANPPSAAAGTQVTLTIAHPGYQYTAGSLKVNGGAVQTSGNGPYTFTMPDADVTVTATFTPTGYSITITPPSNGSVTASVNGMTASAVSVNDIVTLTLTEDTNYKLKSLTVSAGENPVEVIGGTSIRTFTMPASDVTVTAVFQYLQSATSYPVYITTSPNGAIQINGGEDNAEQTAVVEGTFPIITLKPAIDYQLKAGSLRVYYMSNDDEEVQGSGNTWTFTMPGHPVTVIAQFELIPTAGPHNITVPTPDGGTITPDKDQANEGDTITVTLVPGDDRTMPATITVTKDGSGEVTPAGSGGSWTFTMPGVAVTVSAVFDKVYHTITISPMEGGTVKATDTTRQQGLSVGLTIIPDVGFEYTATSLSVTRTDNHNPLVVNDGENSTYKTFTMPASDVKVTASFTGTPMTMPGLYIGSSTSPEELSGEGTMLGKAFAKIKSHNTSTNSSYTIVLNSNESSSDATGYFIGNGSSGTGNGRNVTIMLAGIGEGISVSKATAGPLFTVKSNGVNDKPTLILQNIELKGHAGNTSPLVILAPYSSGTAQATLMMKNGSTISGNTGGGVSIQRNGVFNMSGGTIKGNSAATGAAVLGVENAIFTKTGGTIYGSTSGGDANTPSGGGHVIEIGTKWRDTEAGPEVNLDSAADEGWGE